VRKNTIQVAEDIPEDRYSFKAAPDTMSVAEMLVHLATGTHWAEQLHFVERKQTVTIEDFGRYRTEAVAVGASLTTKAVIIGALSARGEAFAAHLESITEAALGEQVAFGPPIPGPAKSRFEMLLGVKEHEMHHRAQLFLIERVLGIVPHLTRARQQRA
jgi:uncharacterized damage-inducible protein DinB